MQDNQMEKPMNKQDNTPQTSAETICLQL